MFWFLGIRFGPEYFLKINIIVNISDFTTLLTLL